MKNRTIIFASITLAVFLLVIGTGIVTNVLAEKSDSTKATPDVNEFMAREQQYQQLINEANQKLETANQQIIDLAEQATSTSEVPEQPYLFSAEQASQIAANLAGAKSKEFPELVDFNGTPAYEIKFVEGKYVGTVYIDANTGAILYNGLAQKIIYITTEQAISIATNYLGGGTVSRVDFGSYDGLKVYIVQFTNGQSVYIDLKGQIKAVQMAPSIGYSGEESHESDDHKDDD